MEKGQIELGKFSLLSVIVILFWDNQKNIRVGLSGRNNADFWFVYKKNSSDFRTIRETRLSAISRHGRMFF